MDDRTEREVLARLDYIERYLVNNGKVTGFGYAPFATRNPWSGPDGAKDAFGSTTWADDTPEPQMALPFQPAGESGIGGDIVAIAQAGQKLEAIKLYRQRTGASLQQAREAIELALIRGY
jgi:hypothetical protein